MKSIARDKLNLTRSFMSEVYDSEDLGAFKYRAFNKVEFADEYNLFCDC